jgi:hypothetical protein
MNNPIRQSLLELINQHLKLKEYKVCLAVWFDRGTVKQGVACLLEVAEQFDYLAMVHEQANSYGLGSIKTLRHWMVSPKLLEGVLSGSNPAYSELRDKLTDFEVLSIDPDSLGRKAMEKFGAGFTLPENTVVGWYVPANEIPQVQSQGDRFFANARPTAAIAVLEESADFVHRKGLMFSPDPLSGRWFPNTGEGMLDRTWYQDWRQGKPGGFLLRGGRFCRIIGFEVIAKPSFSKIINTSNPDHMYVQVLLKAE